VNTGYVAYHPDQQQLLRSALQDWLPQGHLAYLINDTVDNLNLSAFHARFAGGGSCNQPFPPAMMIKMLIYGYATGVFSSRKLARMLLQTPKKAMLSNLRIAQTSHTPIVARINVVVDASRLGTKLTLPRKSFTNWEALPEVQFWKALR
jgi:hypothetical protein